MRIGDNKVIPIEVRVITATNRNLYNLVLERKFREDLFYRLNVLKIVIPPLRKRYEDIPYLLKHFIQYYSLKLGKPTITLSEEAMEYLSLYNWPGNVRELKNFVERLMVVAKHSQIELSDIKDKFIVVDNVKNDPIEYHLDNQRIHNKINIKKEDYMTLYNSEKEAIINALEDNMGVINFTAKALGISRTTLWRKMKKYNLNVSQ
ncbi:Regulatory protein AtoC [bioreactor metagenome]|uniref:Regulatory protein AtoC n=1 Tax=bioreactor metagenome TaxID=1076179 RepID=A0A645FBL6_9ZZZZ